MYRDQQVSASAAQEDTRKANYIGQSFASSKFTGDLSLSIEHHLRDYETCARQHRLTPNQAAEYFVNSLDGPARTFLLSHFAPGMSYVQVADMMRKEYDSDSRQLQVQSRLEGLKLDSFMLEETISTTSTGLNKLEDLIERLTPQCPVGFRSDENKTRYLRSAVIGHEWAIAPIRSIVTHRYKFHGFVTALHESLQLSEELRTRTVPYSTRVSEASNDDDASEAFFQRYGRHPRSVRKHGLKVTQRPPTRPRIPRRTERNSAEFEEARRRNECFKCGSADWTPGHVCAAGAARNFVRNRVRQGHSQIHIVRDLLLGIEEDAQLAGTGDIPATEGEICPSATNFAEDALLQLDNALAFADVMTPRTAHLGYSGRSHR